jgi:hypothetical protein
VTWRAVNALLAGVSFVLLILVSILWAVAWEGGFIGDTAFIGHMSMLALVLACGAMFTGFLGAWRADVPTDGNGSG